MWNYTKLNTSYETLYCIYRICRVYNTYHTYTGKAHVGKYAEFFGFPDFVKYCIIRPA